MKGICHQGHPFHANWPRASRRLSSGGRGLHGVFWTLQPNPDWFTDQGQSDLGHSGRKLRTTESTRSFPSPKHLFSLLADSKHSLVLRAPDPHSSDPHPPGDMPLPTSPPHCLLLFPRNLFVQQAVASQAPSFLTESPKQARRASFSC